MKKIIRTLFAALPRPISAEQLLSSKNFNSGLGDSAWLLYGLTRSMKPTTCVEIGSAQGKSTCFIGQALKRNGKGKLYAIDPHSATNWNDSASVDTYSVIQANIREAGVSDQIEIVRSKSAEAAKGWNKKIDLIFIDGDHSYEGVKADWTLFLPHMSEFGFAVFHDTLWALRPDSKWSRADMGVPRFVEELRASGYPVLTIDQDFGVSLVQPRQGGVRLS
jgi:predicted O-methyltransferase YrrM